MEKKKVLFIMQSLHGGGAERVTLDLVKNLDKNVFEPTILVVKYFGDLIPSLPKEIKVIKILREDEKVTSNLYKIIRAVKAAASNSDLIVGTLEMTPTYLAAIASVLTGKPAIGWVHINVQSYLKTKSKFHQLLIKKLYAKLKVIVAVSEGTKKSFEAMFPTVQVPIKRIYNPIRLEDIQNMANEENDLKGIEEPIILGVGRLTDMKGFDVLISAHKYILDQNVNNKLVILGEGEERENLERLIKELNVSDSVILKGFVDNPYTYMSSADLFVLSSRYEGFSVVIAEALSVGIPVVSTDCPSGPSEILEDGKYGMLSPVNDSEALAINILKALEMKSDERKNERISRANEFSFQKIVPEFEGLFNETLKDEYIS